MAEDCVNHPGIESTAACPDCGRPFCDSCLVDFMGQRYCGTCRDRRLAQAQGLVYPEPRLAGTGTVDLTGWLSAGWQIVQSDLVTFAVAALLTVLLSLVSCGITAGPMTCGLYLMAFRKLCGRPVEIGNVFDGFRRFLWAFLAFVLIAAAGAALERVLSAPAHVIAALGRDAWALQLMAVTYEWLVRTVVDAGIAGITFFVFPHIAARNVNPIDALGASWSVFRRNPLLFCLTGFAFSLIAVPVGAAACCVGVLVTLPLAVAAQARAYADHFPIEGFDQV